MQTFKDHFSTQSDIYLKYRPHYPLSLYTWLASLTHEHETAWDCGTGNGQAATGLASFYHNVIATDPSRQQIENCLPNEHVRYLVEKAERTSIPSNSIDIITVANALHWFDLDAFFAEANRVLKPGGILAAWAYLLPEVSQEVDEIINHYHYQTLNDYWLPENRLIEKEYTTIPFPYEQIDAPGFVCRKNMNLFDLIGYLSTWSGTQRFIAQNNFNPAERLFDEFLQVWVDPEAEKSFTWKLILKVGRTIKQS